MGRDEILQNPLKTSHFTNAKNKAFLKHLKNERY
ncbi:cag pathogenicity island protein [Helicobacter pylori]|nr:cag pathogenicity island protein [Helicobacter pylori]